MLRPHIAWIIFAKEFRESLRDRRTLVMMVLLPFFLYPALSIVGINLLLQQEASFRVKEIKLVLRQGEPPPQLLRFLSRQGDVRVIKVKDPDRALAQGEVQVALDVAPGAAAALRQGGAMRALIRYDQADFGSMRAADRIEAYLRRFARATVRERIRARALPASFSDPVHTRQFNVAPPEKVRGFLVGGFIPTIMIMMLLMGGFYPAIDLTAGERERSTLETLMTAPISRLEIMAGKFLAVFAFMLLTGIFNLASLGLSAYYVLAAGASHASTIMTAPPVGAMILILVLLIPTAWLFAGVLIAVASLARGFKDAQNYLTPLYMACALPAMAAMIPGYQLNHLNALVPVVNIALLSRQLLLGEWDARLMFVTLAANCLYAAAAVVLAARLYHQESLLTDQNLSTRILLQGDEAPAAVPPAANVTLFLLFEFVLLYYVGGALQMKYELGGLVLTMWGLFALPTLLFVRRSGVPVAAALGLRPVSWRTLAGAACLAPPLVAVANGLLYWQNLVLPVPKALEEELSRFAVTDGSTFAVLAVLFAMAISPGVCEELLFRGLTLRSFLAAMRPGWAVTLTAALFALLHMSLYRLLPTFVLGLVLGALALAGGSIFPAMVLHAVYNGTAVLVATVTPRLGLDQEAMVASPWTWLLLVLLSVLGGMLLRPCPRRVDLPAVPASSLPAPVSETLSPGGGGPEGGHK